MPQTVLNKHTYPSENEEPYYNTIKNFWGQQDVTTFNNKVRSNFILAGGGTLTWNVGDQLFSWTENFAIKNISSGVVIEYEFGPDGLNREASLLNGSLLYGTFPSVLTETETRNLQASSSVDHTDSFFLLGWRWQDNLYFQNGIILA